MAAHTGTGTDSLFIECHICGRKVASVRVECGETLPPWKVIRWHEKAIRHVRREHLRKRGDS